jgi:hypothetical protein
LWDWGLIIDRTWMSVVAEFEWGVSAPRPQPSPQSLTPRSRTCPKHRLNISQPSLTCYPPPQDADEDEDGALVFEEFLLSYAKPKPVWKNLVIMAANTLAIFALLQV